MASPSFSLSLSLWSLNLPLSLIVMLHLYIKHLLCVRGKKQLTKQVEKLVSITIDYVALPGGVEAQPRVRNSRLSLGFIVSQNLVGVSYT